MASRHLRANGRSLTNDETPCFAFGADHPIKWTSEQGELRVNGFPFHLQGTNWRVYETFDSFLAGHAALVPFLFTGLGRAMSLEKKDT